MVFQSRGRFTCARVLADCGHEAAALFHCQQAAEKSLKAFLTRHDQVFRKTHDLRELTAPCVAIDPTIEPIAIATHVLKDYAWKFRYPGQEYVIEKDETAAMLKVTEDFLAGVRARLRIRG